MQACRWIAALGSTTFSFAACDEVYRNAEVFASSPDAADAADGAIGVQSSLLMMGGVQHRRHRALVQPSFVPAKAQWWISKWIDDTVNGLVDSLADQGRAELNVDFCAAIPVLTITGSFGIDVQSALDVREGLRDPAKVAEIVAPIIAARREHPEDDLISVLTEAEITDEDGKGVFEGRTNDEGFDANDHLRVPLTAGQEYTAEVRFEQRVVVALFEPLRPETLARGRIVELAGDPHPVCRLAQAAFEHVANAQFAPHLLHVGCPALVGET